MDKCENSEWLISQKIQISVNLICKAKLHLKFLKEVDTNGKLYGGTLLERAIFRYKYCWLPLLAKHSRSKVINWQLVVPLDCEWIWHCHRLNPVQYVADCKELFGKILDPYSLVLSSIEGTCVEKSKDFWNTMYPEEPYELVDTEDHYIDNSKMCLTDSSTTKYDLVSAVKRQSLFYYQVSRTFVKDDTFLDEALKRYKAFLHLIKRNMAKNSQDFCVPTYDIDLMWHTHQLYPVSYCDDIMGLLGILLDHDDRESDRSKGQKLNVGFVKTTKQWVRTYGTAYWRAGAMYRGPPPVQGPKRCNNPSQSSEVIMGAEVIIEVTEINNIPTNHQGNIIISITKSKNDLLFPGTKKFTIFRDSPETQGVVFQIQLEGALILELFNHDGSSKGLQTCSLTLDDIKPYIATPVSCEFKSETSLPVIMRMVVSTTRSSPICGEHNLNDTMESAFQLLGCSGRGCGPCGTICLDCKVRWSYV